MGRAPLDFGGPEESEPEEAVSQNAAVRIRSLVEFGPTTIVAPKGRGSVNMMI